MNAIFKDFFDDIKDGFNILIEYLSYAIILCLLAGAIHGAETGLDFFLFFACVWLIMYVLFPFFILILDIISHIFGLEKDNK